MTFLCIEKALVRTRSRTCYLEDDIRETSKVSSRYKHILDLIRIIMADQAQHVAIYFGVSLMFYSEQHRRDRVRASEKETKQTLRQQHKLSGRGFLKKKQSNKRKRMYTTIFIDKTFVWKLLVEVFFSFISIKTKNKILVLMAEKL